MIGLIKYTRIISEFQKSYMLDFTIRIDSSDETSKWNGRGKLHVPNQRMHLMERKLNMVLKLFSVEIGLR